MIKPHTMKKMFWSLLIAPTVALGLTGSLAAQANSGAHDLQAELVQSLPDYDSARLFKHHRHLFAAVSNADNTMSIYTANKRGNLWELMDTDADSIANFASNNSAITSFAVHGRNLYAGTISSDGVAEVWSIPTNARPATWEQVGATGLGDADNTSVIDLFQIPGQGLFAVTANPAGNGLFQLVDGTWEQIGEYGFGVELTDALAASDVRVVGDVVNIASSAGIVYQADASNLESWTAIHDFGVEITAMRGRFVATTEDGVAKIYESDADNLYQQVGENDLDQATNEEVTRFVNISRHPAVLVKNSTDGAALYQYQPDTETWESQVSDGFGNANNASATGVIWYHSDRFIATVNTEDGSEIYRLER